jgi:HK97 gp10 family phage protein
MARRSDFTITVVSNRFAEIAAKLPQATGEVVQKTILAIETQAKIKVPVDTGALRASIQTEMETETSGVVSTNQEYAAYVEYGTVNMAARPYMTPAAEGERSHFLDAMSKLESHLE